MTDSFGSGEFVWRVLEHKFELLSSVIDVNLASQLEIIVDEL